jgi:hypothetical protein
MKTITTASSLLLALFVEIAGHAQSLPSYCTNCLFLNSWSFEDTNWLSDAGYSPVGFTNIVNVPGNDGNILLLDTTNAAPAFLFYNVVETNEDSSTFTNITLSTGTLYGWFSPSWSSSNQGGTGPGNYGNLISMGLAGTNGPWWAWYLSPDGDTVYFGSQTNGGSPAVYLSAPVSFLASNWYNLTLTYGPTNSIFYTNGVLVTNGTGVEYWPGSNATFFAIGSDTNGLYQARGFFSDLQTYNFQFDSNTVWDSFSFLTIFYGLGGSGGSGGSSQIMGASSTNMTAPTFDAVTGPGFLVTNGTTSQPTNSVIWITNYAATVISSNVVNLNFAVAGGTNGVPYDVFATAALLDPVTNTVWYWMGQAYRGTNYILPITNLPPANAFIILGTPQDSDHDGLTDAYELFVSHTDPNNPDTSGDGMLDGWKIVWGLNPLANNTASSSQRSNYGYDPASRLDQVFGIRAETITVDGEENVLTAH